MVLNYQETFKTITHDPYERLLIDCMKGDLTLFARQDGVEVMWKIVDPIIIDGKRFHPLISQITLQGHGDHRKLIS